MHIAMEVLGIKLRTLDLYNKHFAKGVASPTLNY